MGHSVVTLTARTIIMTITWWHWYEDLNLSPGRDPSKVKSYLREPLNKYIILHIINSNMNAYAPFRHLLNLIVRRINNNSNQQRNIFFRNKSDDYSYLYIRNLENSRINTNIYFYTKVVDNRRIITSFFWSIMNHY